MCMKNLIYQALYHLFFHLFLQISAPSHREGSVKYIFYLAWACYLPPPPQEAMRQVEQVIFLKFVRSSHMRDLSSYLLFFPLAPPAGFLAFFPPLFTFHACKLDIKFPLRTLDKGSWPHYFL